MRRWPLQNEIHRATRQQHSWLLVFRSDGRSIIRTGTLHDVGWDGDNEMHIEFSPSDQPGVRWEKAALEVQHGLLSMCHEVDRDGRFVAEKPVVSKGKA